MDISDYSEGYWSARKIIGKDTLSGYIDKSGNEHCFEFLNTFDFNEGYAVVQLKSGRYNIVDLNFNAISDTDFEFAMGFKDGFAPIRENGKWSFINQAGRLLFKPKYEDVFWYSNSIASVSLANKWGYINKKGEEICQIKYDSWREFKEEGYAFVSDNNLGWSVIDTLGNTIISPDNYSLSDPYFNEYGIVKVHKQNDQEKFKYGYINKQGNEVVPLIYDRLESFHNYPYTGAATKNINGYETYELIDTSGKVINSTTFDHIHYYYEGGVSMVTTKFIDSKPIDKSIKLDDIELEYLEYEGKMGLIDTTGKIVVPIKYHRLSPEYSIIRDQHFNGQCLFSAQLEKNGLAGVIDDSGKTIVPFNYDFYNIRYLGNGLFYAETDLKEKVIYDTKIQEQLSNKEYHFEKIIRKTCKQNLLVLKDQKTGKMGLKSGELSEWIVKPEFDDLISANKNNNIYKLK